MEKEKIASRGVCGVRCIELGNLVDLDEVPRPKGEWRSLSSLGSGYLILVEVVKSRRRFITLLGISPCVV